MNSAALAYLSSGLAIGLAAIGVALGLAVVYYKTLDSITRQPDLARFYPDRALEREQSGRTVLECQVETNGSLTNCSVVSESPAGAGFGQAALRAVRTMRIEPAMRDGQPVVGRATIPINWRLG